MSGADTHLSATPVTTRRSTTVWVSRNGQSLLRAHDANTFLSRLRGLHGLMPLAIDEALIIRPCSLIQTWRMPATIDVAFVDRQGVICKLTSVPPNRVVGSRRACVTIEMAHGAIEHFDLNEGEVLSLSSGAWA